MWTAPEMPNGIIRDYQITYFPTANASSSTVLNTSSDGLEFNITDLEAFTNYSISILAITVASGEPSDVMIVLTNENSKYDNTH